MDRSHARKFIRSIRTHLGRNNEASHHETASAFQLEPLEQRVLLDAAYVDMTYANAWQVLPLNSAGQYAMFEAIRPGTATGTGLINSCAKMNADTSTGIEQGYNTDAPTSGDTVLHDVQKAHSLLLTDLPLVKVAGEWYREFWLDVVESSTYLSLDKLQIFLGDGAALTGYPGFGGHAQRVFDLDTDLAAADATDGAWMGLQDLNAGSGQGDYRFFIPEDLFQSVLGAHPTYQYVYLYSRFGGDGVSGQQVRGGGTVTDWKADSGGEEWFVFETGAERGTISGYKFNDLNGNGIDDSEPRLNGWTIELYKENDGNTTFDAGDTFVTSMVTSGLGAYGFIGLSLASYYVRENPSAEQLAAGWTQKTTDPGLIVLGANDFIDPSTIGYAGLAFGNACFSSLSGYKYEDMDGDGDITEDTAHPLDGWTIQLYKWIGDTWVKQDEVVTGTGPWADGYYQFDYLTPGAYRVQEVVKDNWTPTVPNTTKPNYYDVAVASGVDETGYDFGNFELGWISGYKYEDVDGDGNLAADTGNPLNDWTIELYKWVSSAWVKQGEVVTGAGAWADGYYEFTGLGLGAYEVREVLKSGWSQTAPTGGVYDRTVAASSFESTGNNFGNFEQGWINGYKYEDADGDGNIAEDTTDPLDGWTIQLYKWVSDAWVKQGEVVTGAGAWADGYYEFAGLGLGTYQVREVLKSGWSQTAPAGGLYDRTVAASSFEGTGNNFGNFEQGWISGYKYEDADGDGNIAEDTGHPLDGWTIQLYKWVGDTWVKQGEVVTGTGVWADGYYEFTGLNAGLYQVREVLKAGWSQTAPVSGVYQHTVASDFEAASDNFGNCKLGSVSGIKFEDLDANGSKDGGEPGLAGWTIQLTGTDGLGHAVNRSVTTADGIDDDLNGDSVIDPIGFYWFSVAPGTYTVAEVLQAGWAQSYPASGHWDVIVGSGAALTAKSFGNYRPAGFGGIKFEDLNANHVQDAGEPGLGGFVIRAYADLNSNGILDQADYNHGVVASDTSDNGTGAYYLSLAPGSYIIVEIVQSGSFQTFPTLDVVGTVTTSGAVLGQYGYAATLTSGQDEDNNDFGNYVSHGNAHSPGFWGSKNGEAQIQALISSGINVWGTLTALNLRNENGSHFNPTKFTDFSKWLRGGNSRNAAYMLSVQLATMELNVLAGFAHRGDRVFLGTPDPILVIGDVMDDANALLGMYGVLDQKHPQRASALSLMDILAKANTNLNWWTVP